MESRWYVPQGKILADTKIEDRKHALHIAKDNWGKITAHLDRTRLIDEEVQAEEDKKKYMKEASKAMTSTWYNSVENIRKRTEQERSVRAAKDYDKNVQYYLVLKEEQEKERENFVQGVQQRLQRKEDYPRALTSALMLSEACYERDKQLEFKKIINAREVEEEEKEAAKIRRGVEEEVKEREEKRVEEIAKNRKYRAELLEQLTDIKAEREFERVQRERDEVKDNELANEEIKAIDAQIYKKQMEKKERTKKNMTDYLEEDKKIKETLRREENEIDAVIEIIGKSKHRIACITKEKEQEAILERERKAAELSRKAEALQMDNTEREEAKFRAAVAEKLEIELQRERDREEKRLRLRQERIDDWNDYVVREARRKYEEKEIKKYEMLDRFKKAEMFAKDEAIEKGAEQTKQIANALTFQEQAKTTFKGEEEIREKKYRAALQEKDVRNDASFFKYADEVLDYAKTNGRITYPIKKVIAKYKADVMGERPPEKVCQHSFNCPQHADFIPGKLLNDLRNDPNFTSCQCNCHKNRLYK